MRRNRETAGGTTDIVEVLIATLATREGTAALHAAEALGALHDERAVEPLIGALQSESSSDSLRWFAVQALGDLGHERAVGPLIKTLSDIHLADDAARALGKIGSSSAVSVLLEQLKSTNDGLVGTAASALGDIGDAGATEPLIRLLQHRDFNVRGYAIRALGLIGDRRALQPLVSFLRIAKNDCRDTPTDGRRSTPNPATLELVTWLRTPMTLTSLISARY